MQNLIQFYNKIKKHIAFASINMNDASIDFIIKCCRLKPYNLLFNKSKFSYSFYIENKWIDEFGNSIYFTKNKKIKVKINDLQIDKSQLINTDMFFAQSIKTTAKNSKIVCVVIGKDEDTNSEYYQLLFLGNDNFLRGYYYIYGRWHRNISPLEFGIKTIRYMAVNLNIKTFAKLPKIIKPIFACSKYDVYIGALPAQKTFANLINRKSKILTNIIGE